MMVRTLRKYKYRRDWEQVSAESTVAYSNGFSDCKAQVPRDMNPYTGRSLPQQREHWFMGWDAYKLTVSE